MKIIFVGLKQEEKKLNTHTQKQGFFKKVKKRH